MASESIIKVLITGDEYSLKKATAEAQNDLKKTEEGHSKFKQVANTAMAGAAAAGVAFLVSSVEVANKFKEAHDRMDNAFKNTGVQGGKWVSDAEKQGQRFGYSRDKIDNALASSVRALGNAAGAHKALNVAEDVAAATGMDLQDATMMVTKATEGNTKALKKLGIEYTGAKGGAAAVANAQKAVATASNLVTAAHDKLVAVQMKVHASTLKGSAANFALLAAQGAVSKATDNLREKQKALADAHAAGGKIVDLLASKYKNSAKDASETFEGKVKSLHAAFTNFQATVGEKVIPILTKLIDWITKSLVPALSTAFQWLQKHKPMWIAVAAVVLALALALDAPIVALAALAAGLVYAWTHFKTFRDVVTNTMNVTRKIIETVVNIVMGIWGRFGTGIMRLITTTWNFVKTYIQSVLMIVKGIFNIFAGLFTGDWGRMWNGIKQVFQGVWNLMIGYVKYAMGIISGVISLVGGAISYAWNGLWSGMRDVLGGIWDGIKNVVRGGVNGLIGIINGVISAVDGIQAHIHISMPGPIPNINFDWGGLGIPHIPYLHTGGVFESGRGEGLAMLRDGEGIFTPEQMRAIGKGSGGQGGNVYMNFPAGVDPKAVAASYSRYVKRNGSR